MKITVLGCGTSTGVPLPNCDCHVCTSTDPKDVRFKTSSLITTDDGYNILIDATPDFRHQALRERIKRIDAVILTHPHSDHVLGLDDLRPYFFKNNNVPIPLYTNESTFKEISRVFNYVFEPQPNYLGGGVVKFNPHIIKAYTPFNLLGLEILPVSGMHGRMEVYGFRFGNFGYLTDVNIVPTETIDALKGISTLFLDGLRKEKTPSHQSFEEAIDVAKAINAEKTYLVHMSHNTSYQESKKLLPKNIEFAYDGLVVR